MRNYSAFKAVPFAATTLLVKKILTVSAVLAVFGSFAHGNLSCGQALLPISVAKPQGLKNKAYGQLAFEKHMDDVALPLSRVQPYSKTKDPVEVVGQLLKQDARYSLFFIQSLMSVYGPHAEKALAPIAEKFRNLEDAIGEAALSFELEKTATKLNLPPELLTSLAKEKIVASKKLLAFIGRNEWHKPSMTESLKQQIDELKIEPWDESKFLSSDREIFLTESVERIQKLRDDIENNKFTPTDLNLGFHALRRKLRIVLMRFRSFSGVVRFSEDKPIKEFAQTDTPKNRENKYTVLDPVYAKDKHLISIPRTLLYGMAELVVQMGERKDQAEASEFLSKKMHDLKLVESEELGRTLVEQKYKELGVIAQDPEKLFTDTVNLLKRTQLLKTMQKLLNSQI
jgi:hypothetical protein